MPEYSEGKPVRKRPTWDEVEPAITHPQWRLKRLEVKAQAIAEVQASAAGKLHLPIPTSIPPVTLPVGVSRWIGPFSAPLLTPPGHAWDFYGVVTFVQTEPMTGKNFRIDFWHKPPNRGYGWLGGWQFILLSSPGAWYRSGYLGGAPYPIFHGDELGVAITAVGAHLVNPVGIAVSVW